MCVCVCSGVRVLQPGEQPLDCLSRPEEEQLVTQLRTQVRRKRITSSPVCKLPVVLQEVVCFLVF